MEWVAFIVAVGALTLSVWALKRTGGLADMTKQVDSLSSLGLTELKKQVESLSSTGETFRKKTADLLERLEKRVRGEEKKEEPIRKEEVEVGKGDG
jgi:hypothetical protein